MDKWVISFNKYGVAPHTTPSGKEGYECTVEEVYGELLGTPRKKKKKNSQVPSSSGGDGESDGGDKDGDVRFSEYDKDMDCDLEDGEESDENDKEQTMLKGKKGDKGKSASKNSKSSEDADSREDNGDFDLQNECSSNSDSGWECTMSAMSGKSVQNSKTKNKSKEKGSFAAPAKADLEALIMSLKNQNQQISQKYAEELLATKKERMEDTVVPTDDHSFWQGDADDNYLRDSWYSYTMQAVNLVMEKEEAHKGYGGPPVAAIRLVRELTHPEVDWRTMLNEFVQEEVNDYSFSPPDRRMDDSPFFLPDFNEKEESVKNVWFLIDTSGSIGDKQIAAAYSEIVSAIDIFQNLEGLLSFTEVFVTDPVPFCSEEELLKIKPVGGGGNNFGEIFRYMQNNMMDNLPVSIVIFTDGYDRYPKEEEALGIPVLWLINNEEATPPPWGKWARFKVNT